MRPRLRRRLLRNGQLNANRSSVRALGRLTAKILRQ
jgi:hypothetical protein